jgi:uncharacterized protein (TIGR03086 family)
VSLLDLHRRAMRHSVDVVGLIGDDQWDAPTPCTQWTLRQLVEHMTSENRGFAAAADGETADRTVWDLLDLSGDLRADYLESAERVVRSFNRPGVLDGEFWLPKIRDSVRFPARQAIGFHLLDYVVHSWDVAASLRHPIAFDDDLVAAVQEVADRDVPDGPRRHRPGATFAPPVPVDGGVPAQDRLLAVLGRPPDWTP